ncbi:acetyl-CoA hydrolase/transferase C-terminal domain-containing protein, partial [Brevundimonas sp.]|uniref:acetyl-CoA hydrolase/transferase C-terminal domain-containing protein n=1 Tax=Brevundimonas sp. TaxID=1871086 RepID=UPI00257E7C10
MSRIRCSSLRSKLMSAEDAAALIPPGSTVGMSGFTGSGYPKLVPPALARRIEAAHDAGSPFRLNLWTGASTGPELDGALAKADGIERRLPYNSDPIAREKINSGQMDYLDMHLSHLAPMVWQGVLGSLDTAVIEVSAVKEDGSLVPSSSIGNNKTWLDRAERVILEVNAWQDAALEGMHDIYYGTALPPNRVPIPLTRPDQLIGQPTLRCDPDKIVAIVETEAPGRNLPFAAPDANARAIAGHLIEFLKHEVRVGRLPAGLLPLQSGVGNVANAVLAGLMDSPFERMAAYTEVIQDGMLDLLDAGKLTVASATAFSLSPEAAADLNSRMEQFRGKIILRPQEISNHPELIRRLGCIAMNGLLEADIYGNVNSTQVMGSRIQNGIGGSGDFSRNAF